MTVDLTREELERIVKRFEDLAEPDLVDRSVLRKVYKRLPPGPDEHPERKYQDFGGR